MSSLNRQREDIYLLSLDTFMILAISGICIGIIFIVFNSQVGRYKPPLKAQETQECEYIYYSNFKSSLNSKIPLEDYLEINSDEIIYDGRGEEALLIFDYDQEKNGFSIKFKGSKTSCLYPKNQQCLSNITSFIANDRPSFRNAYNATLKTCISGN